MFNLEVLGLEIIIFFTNACCFAELRWGTPKSYCTNRGYFEALKSRQDLQRIHFDIQKIWTRSSATIQDEEEVIETPSNLLLFKTKSRKEEAKPPSAQAFLC